MLKLVFVHSPDQRRKWDKPVLSKYTSAILPVHTHTYINTHTRMRSYQTKMYQILFLVCTKLVYWSGMILVSLSIEKILSTNSFYVMMSPYILEHIPLIILRLLFNNVSFYKGDSESNSYPISLSSLTTQFFSLSHAYILISTSFN